jgi:hypothetical protein
MSAAAYTLLGVGIASAFAIAKDLLVEGRRDRFERERLWRRESQDGRVACLLIADELDTLSHNFNLVATARRSPMRPIGGESPFLSTREWHSGKSVLARVIDQMDTWQSLTTVYHDADSMRTRFIIDGPNAPIADDQAEKAGIRAHETAALAEVLNIAAVNFVRRLEAGLPSRSRWPRRLGRKSG